MLADTKDAVQNIARIGTMGLVTTLTGATLPAAPRGDAQVQKRPATPHSFPPFVETPITNRLPQDVTLKLPPRVSEVALEDVPSTSENGTSLQRTIFSLLGPAFAMTSMGWYYCQLRARQTVGSLTTSVLATVNGSILVGSALLTVGEGIGTPLLYTTNLVFNVLIGRELWSQRKSASAQRNNAAPARLIFSATEKGCAGAALLGMASLLASNLPVFQQLLSQDTLLIASKAIALGVGVVITVPWMASAFARPKSDEALDVVGSRWWTIAKPVLPYLLGTGAIGLAGASVEQYTVATLLAPIGMALHNCVMMAGVMTWAFRRTVGRGTAAEDDCLSDL